MKIWMSEQNVCTLEAIAEACGTEAGGFYADLQSAVFEPNYPTVCHSTKLTKPKPTTTSAMITTSTTPATTTTTAEIATSTIRAPRRPSSRRGHVVRNSTSGFERSNAINYRPAKVVRNIEPSTPATLEEHLLSLIDKLFPMALPLNTTKLFQTLTDGRVATVDTDGYDRRDVRSSLHTIIHTT
ncbi:Protein C05E11.7, partial [Aphelenchoides avenae]